MDLKLPTVQIEHFQCLFKQRKKFYTIRHDSCIMKLWRHDHSRTYKNISNYFNTGVDLFLYFQIPKFATDRVITALSIIKRHQCIDSKF